MQLCLDVAGLGAQLEELGVAAAALPLPSIPRAPLPQVKSTPPAAPAHRAAPSMATALPKLRAWGPGASAVSGASRVSSGAAHSRCPRRSVTRRRHGGPPLAVVRFALREADAARIAELEAATGA